MNQVRLGIFAAGLFAIVALAFPGEANARKLGGKLVNLDNDSRSYLLKCNGTTRGVIDAETEEAMSFEGCTLSLEDDLKPVGKIFKLNRLSTCTIKRNKLSCN